MLILILSTLFIIILFLGWRREFVFRSSGATLSNIYGDVYYYTPSNQKLRSLREVQKQLNLLTENNPLTIDNFTFYKQAIGIKDKSKELIRNAKTKLSKVIKETKLCNILI